MLSPSTLMLTGAAVAAGVAVDRRFALSSDLRQLAFAETVARHVRRAVADRALIPDLFQRSLRQFPTRVCLAFKDRALTFQQVDEAASRVARWGLRQGLERGAVVALVMENRPEFIVFWLGMLKIGVVSALVNTHLKADGLLHSIQVAEPKLVVVGVELLDAVSSVVGQLDGLPCHVAGDGVSSWTASSAHPFAQSLDEQLLLLETRPASLLPRGVCEGISPMDTALLIYTSGTTGMPKAARVSHINFYAVAISYILSLNVTERDRLYCALPLYHSSGGKLAVGICLFSGAALCLATKFSVSKFWHDVRRFDATLFQYIGEMCRYLVNAPPQPTDRDNQVRAVIGNGLRPDVWHEFQDRFGIPVVSEFYGSTEGVIGFTNRCASMEDRGHLGRRGLIMQNRLGAKIVQFDVENDSYVRDPQTGFVLECGIGQIGELLCQNQDQNPARKFGGYYKNKDESSKKMIRDVFRKGDAYYRTGDLFKIDSQRRWHFIDRIGDTFRWKGENVATNEVAEAIAKFPGLGDICVYGVKVPGSEGRACMAAMVFDETTFDMAAFATHVQARLPSYAVPLFLRQLGEMSVTGTMKYEKAKLREQGLDPSQIEEKMWYFVQELNTFKRWTPETFQSAFARAKL